MKNEAIYPYYEVVKRKFNVDDKEVSKASVRFQNGPLIQCRREAIEMYKHWYNLPYPLKDYYYVFQVVFVVADTGDDYYDRYHIISNPGCHRSYYYVARALEIEAMVYMDLEIKDIEVAYLNAAIGNCTNAVCMFGEALEEKGVREYPLVLCENAAFVITPVMDRMWEMKAKEDQVKGIKNDTAVGLPL